MEIPNTDPSKVSCKKLPMEHTTSKAYLTHIPESANAQQSITQ